MVWLTTWYNIFLFYMTTWCALCMCMYMHMDNTCVNKVYLICILIVHILNIFCSTLNICFFINSFYISNTYKTLLLWNLMTTMFAFIKNLFSIFMIQSESIVNISYIIVNILYLFTFAFLWNRRKYSNLSERNITDKGNRWFSSLCIPV